MPLTDKAVRNTKPGDRPIKLFDGGGLFLIVASAGGKWWRFKYRFAGKEKLISLGTYPEVALKEARDRRDSARKQLASGIDPSAARKATKSSLSDRASNSFEVVAREWLTKFSPRWTPTHIDNITRRLEKNIFPWIGSRPIAEVSAPELLAVLRRIENRGAIETAHRAQQNCSQVFRYAIATGRAERDPSPDLRGALAPVQEKHLAAITDPKAVGRLLRAIDAYEGSFVTKCALRLAPLVFVRPGELRHAEWAEVDFERAEWNIPLTRMKMREPHLVPLSIQSLEILKELKPLTGEGRYVFPGARSNKRPMSENTVLAALRNMGFAKDEMSGHGFRAMARTILDEVLHIRPDYIEHQLGHAVRDPNGRAYNRTAHLDERRKMMQLWADYLNQLKANPL
jgi:integrase